MTPTAEGEEGGTGMSNEDQKEEDDEEHVKNRSKVSAVSFKPPSPERERTLLGELLFLKLQMLLGKESPVEMSSKVVGMLLQLPLPELRQLVGSSSLLRQRLAEALKLLGIQQAAPTSTSGEAALEMRPPVARQAELLFLALSCLLGDRDLALSLTSSLQRRLTEAELVACLVEEKRLRTSIKALSKTLEKELKDEKGAEPKSRARSRRRSQRKKAPLPAQPQQAQPPRQPGAAKRNVTGPSPGAERGPAPAGGNAGGPAFQPRPAGTAASLQVPHRKLDSAQAASATSAAAAAASATTATPGSASVAAAGPAVAKDEAAVAAPEVKQVGAAPSASTSSGKAIQRSQSQAPQASAPTPVAEASRAARAASAEPDPKRHQDSGQSRRPQRTKRKGHVWSPVTDAFEVARANLAESEEAKEKASTSKPSAKAAKAPAPQPDRLAQQEIRQQLQALAESKLRAVENEDFELAQQLKQQEQELQQLCGPTKSWASIATPAVPPTRSVKPGVGVPPNPNRSLSPARTAAPKTGKLVFVLTAPARIATAALWRGRSLCWDDVHEIVFIFEDYHALHITPRFVASCPEYHLIMVLARALEGTGMPGSSCEEPAPEFQRQNGYGAISKVAKYGRSAPSAVVLLHEAFPQSLGLFDRSAGSRGDSLRNLVFFLGAVKDMTPEERGAVHRACRHHSVPCVEANLGQQAEFTSKIIDVLHGHHLYGRLAPAVWRCTRHPQKAEQAEVTRPAPPSGLLWVFVPQLAKKADGAVVAVWMTKCCKEEGRAVRNSALLHFPALVLEEMLGSSRKDGEHRSHALSFVYPNGEVLTVNPSLVTCLKLQHRAAPTERNLVNALRVATGDWKADPNLTVDEGCVVLGKASDIMAQRGGGALLPQRTALVDLELDGIWSMDGQSGPGRLDVYASVEQETQKPVRDVVVLLHGERDFPRGFRESLAQGLLGFKSFSKSPWQRLLMPRLSIHAAISLLGHYWDTRALASPGSFLQAFADVPRSVVLVSVFDFGRRLGCFAVDVRVSALLFGHLAADTSPVRSPGNAARVAWEELISSEEDGGDDGEPWSSASKRNEQGTQARNVMDMYGLRLINNFYADFAGTRSDFVIVGHPEYNLGKAQSDYGYKEGWDNRPIPSKPGRSLPGDRIQRKGKAAYLEALAKPPCKASYKERALAKSQSDTQVRARASGRDAGGTIDTFLEELQAMEKLPPCSPNRLTSGWANDIRSQPVMKHYSAVQEDLEVLRRRLHRTPSAVKAELQQDDAWRYYDLYFQQAKKNGEQIRQTKLKANKMMEKAMRGTD
ncbi:unnamed protein product [Symbiodinium sp. CCMP2456]|nr:unnamed protein product [Symbiodinium sp. CCMP2456]